MDNLSKKRFIPHILHLLLIPCFIRTMFLDNTYYYYSPSYTYSYIYGYKYKYKLSDGYTEHYNFFESIFDEVLPGIFAVLMFLSLLLLLILTIVSLSSKKLSVTSIIAFVLPFLITFDYGGYLIFTDIFGRNICDAAFFMFIPLAFMNLVSIIGFLLYAIDKKSAKAATVNDAPYITPDYSQFTSGVKYCTNCGNEAIAQAVICPNCGCSFN